MTPVLQFWIGLTILAGGLGLFAWISHLDWRHEVLQLIVMAIMVGVITFGFALFAQGLWAL